MCLVSLFYLRLTRNLASVAFHWLYGVQVEPPGLVVLRDQPRRWVSSYANLFQRANRNMRINLRGVEPHVPELFCTKSGVAPSVNRELAAPCLIEGNPPQYRCPLRYISLDKLGPAEVLSTGIWPEMFRLWMLAGLGVCNRHIGRV
jgi:hypothetical protein